ncbi:17352_t:CDS:2 [Acaulospora morrowiae]|uniref:DNA replication complex GINS protein PSF3 n=1 Tax=Acaulospora morrowiae TaxID=94023 RepID=A0A9N9E739_9GLOM|nr:17352_t:CDS:2 [Acaulospora morrowiae]
MSEQNIEQFLAKETNIHLKEGSCYPKTKNSRIRKHFREYSINRTYDPVDANEHKIEIPFYVAAALEKRKLAKMERPKFLEMEIINALKVNPLYVNLRRICPQFYTFAIKYLELHEDAELIEVLMKSKKIRSLEIYDRAKRFYEDHKDFIEKLDDGELKMFEKQRAVCEESYVDYTRDYLLKQTTPSLKWLNNFLDPEMTPRASLYVNLGYDPQNSHSLQKGLPMLTHITILVKVI